MDEKNSKDAIFPEKDQISEEKNVKNSEKCSEQEEKVKFTYTTEMYNKPIKTEEEISEMKKNQREKMENTEEIEKEVEKPEPESENLAENNKVDHFLYRKDEALHLTDKIKIHIPESYLSKLLPVDVLDELLVVEKELKQRRGCLELILGIEKDKFEDLTVKIAEDQKNHPAEMSFTPITVDPDVLRIDALPDTHSGYTFPIGSVIKTNVVVPVGIGSDINCGVRMCKVRVKEDASEKQFFNNLHCEENAEIFKKMMNEIFAVLPSGVGEGNNSILSEVLERINENRVSDEKMTENEFFNGILDSGLTFLSDHGVIPKDTLNCVEDMGTRKGNSRIMSQKAKARGKLQLGSLGAGNHFLEFQKVEKLYSEVNEEKCSPKDVKLENMSLEENVDSDHLKGKDIITFDQDQLVFMIHTGSRGFGKLICDEGVALAQDEDLRRRKLIQKKAKELKVGKMKKPPKEKFTHYKSEEATDRYLSLMNSAANFAYANRAIIHFTVESVLN